MEEQATIHATDEECKEYAVDEVESWQGTYICPVCSRKWELSWDYYRTGDGDEAPFVYEWTLISNPNPEAIPS